MSCFSGLVLFSFLWWALICRSTDVLLRGCGVCQASLWSAGFLFTVLRKAWASSILRGWPLRHLCWIHLINCAPCLFHVLSNFYLLQRSMSQTLVWLFSFGDLCVLLKKNAFWFFVLFLVYEFLVHIDPVRLFSTLIQLDHCMYLVRLIFMKCLYLVTYFCLKFKLTWENYRNPTFFSIMCWCWVTILIFLSHFAFGTRNTLFWFYHPMLNVLIGKISPFILRYWCKKVYLVLVLWFYFKFPSVFMIFSVFCCIVWAVFVLCMFVYIFSPKSRVLNIVVVTLV